MKTSYRKIAEFSETANFYLAQQGKKQTKLTLALRRVQAQIRGLKDRVEQKLTDLSIDFASVDENDILLTNDKGGFRYTKDNLKKRNAAETEMLDKKDVVVEACLCALVPDDLSDAQLEAFSGFVIDPERVKAIRAQRLEEIQAPEPDPKKSEDRANGLDMSSETDADQESLIQS